MNIDVKLRGLYIEQYTGMTYTSMIQHKGQHKPMAYWYRIVPFPYCGIGQFLHKV